jgi:hypothetical protein
MHGREQRVFVKMSKQAPLSLSVTILSCRLLSRLVP